MHHGTAGAGTGVARRSRIGGRVSALVAIGAAAAIALAACGGSSSNSSSKKSTTSTTKKSSGAAATAAVKTASSSLGTIVVTNDGKTVYTLTNAGQQVPCSGTCLMVWPPVSVAAGAKASGTGVKNVGTTASGQVTINGAPVYTFQGDSAAGNTNGQGIMSFGGTWNVVMSGGTSGGSSGGGTGTSTPATTAKSGSGY
jgi:predicted lipoprotein with Yx(FWY)xxD motif